MESGDEINLLSSTLQSAGVNTSIASFCSNFSSCSLLAANEANAPTAADYFAVLRRRVAEQLQQGTRSAALQVLTAGVQCLEGFVQLNLCGPVQTQHVPLFAGSRAAGCPASTAAPQLGQDSLSTDDRWVAVQLEVDGEELLGRVQGLDLLLAALLCVAEPYGCYTTSSSQQQQQQQQEPEAASLPEDASAGSLKQQQQQLQQEWLCKEQLGSWCWWALRAVMLQQHVLHGKSNTLRSTLQQLVQQTLAWAHSQGEAAAAAAGNATAGGASADAAAGVVASASALRGMLPAAAHLECSLVQQHYGQMADAQQQLEEAAAALGVEVQVTGVLGFRTKHQLDPKAQLVASFRGAAAAAATGAADGVDLPLLGFAEAGLTKELEGMEDDSAVYLAPRLTAENTAATVAATAAAGTGSSSAERQQQQQHMSCMLQALLLGWAAQIKKGTSQDELQQWQMAPFVEAVLQQQSTQCMLHATARLLKCRHEKERGRTRERSLMQLEQLCSALQLAQPGAAMRLPFCFAVRFPLWPLLRKELAELYIAMGFVGAALRIFEGLEMWDPLILCYRLLDKKQAAQELVLQRLQVNPDDAKLWCVLGDIQQQEQHYEKAWQVSGRRSSRAQRSIARSAMQRKEYARAAAAYELALRLNPLYPEAWFAQGYCYLRIGDNTKALQAFTKVTHLEPDNGEAWTNLAALWLQQRGWKEALQASEQAVKYKRDSWQTWDNYASAAAKAGAMSGCVRALSQVFELTKGQQLSLETAEQLMTQLELEQQQLQGNTPDSDNGSSRAATLSVHAAEAGGAKEAGVEAEEEAMDAPEQLLQLLAVTDGLPDLSRSGDAAAHAAQAAAAAAARQRAYDQVLASFGVLLKSAANAAACGPGVWGLLGRLYRLQGQLLSSQEAWLKQVRALQSSPYKSDPDAFAAMATGTDHLCRAYLAAATSPGQRGLRELAAARMQLRGLLKQCEEAFGEQQQYKQLQGLLEEVLAAEDAALAAKKAAEAAGL
ncbi:hypothetical protein COO60DRAFT_1008225 [Scenedesmus sp. NREL 46B-D3]|nr:hypothetical protein COO60DRAFT_1008225 [Scenedesmus sp. NREL 46B-D3]